MQPSKQIPCILAAMALSLGGCAGFGTDQDLDAALDSQATATPRPPRSDYQPAQLRQPRTESARPFEAGGLNRRRANSFDPFEPPPSAATSAQPRKSPAPGESPIVTQKSHRPETDVKTVAHHEAIEITGGHLIKKRWTALALLITRIAAFVPMQMFEYDAERDSQIL